MLFSVHVADTSPLAAVRRRTPQAADVAGLKSARNGIGAPFVHSHIPRPQLGREVLLACWEDESSLDMFLESHAFGQAMASGWQARLELVRAVGVWPGLDDDMMAEAGNRAETMTGPSVAITIGTAFLKSAVPFARVTKGLDRQFLQTPTGLWGTAMTNLPQRLVASLTVWQDLGAAADYMKTGAHAQAVQDHFDFNRDPTGHTFVTGGGFFGFRPLSTSGSLSGRNPLAESLLSV